MINENNDCMKDCPGEGGFKLDHQAIARMKKEFEPWIQEKYPTLINDADSILKDVFKKMEKKISKTTEPMTGEVLRDSLLDLAESECSVALPIPENQKKNMGLTRNEFKNYVAELKIGNEDLIEKVYLAHFSKCVKYLMNNKKCSFEDAHESSLEALLEIRTELIAEKIFYGNLGYYFTRRAQNKLYKIQIKKKHINSNIEEVEIEDPDNMEQDIYDEQLQEIVAEALSKMPAESQQLLRLYYYEEMSFKEIAVIMNKNHDAIRQDAKRCRDKLRKLLGEDFYIQFATYFK